MGNLSDMASSFSCFCQDINIPNVYNRFYRINGCHCNFQVSRNSIKHLERIASLDVDAGLPGFVHVLFFFFFSDEVLVFHSLPCCSLRQQINFLSCSALTVSPSPGVQRSGEPQKALKHPATALTNPGNEANILT